MIRVTFSLGHQTGASGISFNYWTQQYIGWANGPNSQGGVSVLYTIQNVGTKTIKYYTLYFVPYNAVHDPVACRISDATKFGGVGTGPIEPMGSQVDRLLENAWYNNTIIRAELVEVEIEYMDGSTEVIDGTKILPIEQKGFKKGTTGGCYIATAVYGSYNCPEVWTLRRYRDYKLAKSWHGRLFIRIYYNLSPILVKLFGKRKWFKTIWLSKLNKKVTKLQKKGFDSTEYEDLNW